MPIANAKYSVKCIKPNEIKEFYLINWTFTWSNVSYNFNFIMIYYRQFFESDSEQTMKLFKNLSLGLCEIMSELEKAGNFTETL
jgi:hypothetical protein